MIAKLAAAYVATGIAFALIDSVWLILMAPGCDYLTGAVIALDGGQWLASGGNFHSLSALDGDDWATIKGAIQATNAKDRAARSA
jgi:hypothetical protein